jgi:VWFA-related protein
MTKAFQIDPRPSTRIEKFIFSTRYAVFVQLIISSFALFGFAQSDENIVRVDTKLAQFEVLVEDQNGKPVHGLKQGDFRIIEDGKERRIDFFQPVVSPGTGRPLVIAFAVDVSGSMTAPEIEKLRNAISGFIGRFGDHESYFAVISFAMEVKRLQSFTNRPELLKKAMQSLDREQSGRSTHAFDAVDDAVRLIQRSAPKSVRGRAPKNAVIVITDGFPVGDTVDPRTVIERANRAGTSIYSVILPSYSPTGRDTRPLMTLFDASGVVERTGGNSLYAVDNNFEPLFQALAAEITSSYAVAFYPDGQGASKRNVRIESTKGYRIKQNRTTYEIQN